MNVPVSVNCKFAAPGIGLVLICVLSSTGMAKDSELLVISSRPDAVSGGSALVQVRPAGSNWRLFLNRRDVTNEVHADRTGDLIALLDGLTLGSNALEVRFEGRAKSELDLVNHPLAGPIFSGPHQIPFICQTEASGLGPATDANCDAKTVVEYYYKSTEPMAAESKDKFAPGFKAYDLAGPPPTDVARTTTSDGQTVDYIVRREIGVINRSVYEIQFLHRPGEPLPSPWNRVTSGWNGRLVYTFPGGCAAGNRQGLLSKHIGLLDEPFISQGYATATSTLNVFANSCNDRVAAETMSMVKEHFIKQYGVPAHTMGWGGSGGSIEQHLIAQNYPGLLDGLIAYLSYPDMANVVQSSSDCALLERAVTASKQSWSEQQKTAVSGLATWRRCGRYDTVNGKSRYLNPQACDALLPKEAVYDESARPDGVRCDLFDNEIDVFGRDPRTGFARRPLDNVGVQYGLIAFNNGTIDAEHFIELNEQVGGYDQDGNIVTRRTQADSETVRLAYERGLVLTGGGALSQVPIIDWRWYADDLVDDGHDRVRSFVTRARLVAANGNADNQIIIVDPRTMVLNIASPRSDSHDLYARRARGLVQQMNHWLDNITTDSATGNVSEKLSRNRPSDLTDGCWATDGERIVEPATAGGAGRCNQEYPAHGDPRIAAGGPLTDDILKCELKPLRATDYVHPLNAAQLGRLRAIFPDGVCDFNRPGVGQPVALKTWQKF